MVLEKQLTLCEAEKNKLNKQFAFYRISWRYVYGMPS